jgi:hypothetical protein
LNPKIIQNYTKLYKNYTKLYEINYTKIIQKLYEIIQKLYKIKVSKNKIFYISIMVQYYCKRCGYTTKHKASFLNHLNRKNICATLLEDISIEEIKFTYGFEMSHIESKMNPNESKMNPTDSKMNPIWKNKNESKMNPNESKMNPFESKINSTEKNKEYICNYCGNCYSTNSNMRKHEKTCKVKKENEKKDNEIKELKEMVEKLLLEKGNSITNNTNNTNNSNNSTTNNDSFNTNNTIIINNYGDEDTKYITSDYILNLLKYKPAKAIPELIKHTHFNVEHPENQNIKITNKKEPYIKVRKNDKWELQNKDETINDLIDRQQIHLMDESIEKKIEESCNNSEKVNIERCSELYNNDDKNYMKRLYNESELIIINNS